MSIQMVVSDKVGFSVSGAINDEAGVGKAFEFSLVCRRLKRSELNERIKSNPSVVDFMAELVIDWKGVKDGEGTAVPFSVDSFRALCEISGVETLVYHRYLSEVGAKAKN